MLKQSEWINHLLFEVEKIQQKIKFFKLSVVEKDVQNRTDILKVQKYLQKQQRVVKLVRIITHLCLEIDPSVSKISLPLQCLSSAPLILEIDPPMDEIKKLLERENRVGRIYHVGLTVPDLERSIAFYRDILGLEFQGEIL